jgi:hypothetical protein
MKTNGNGIVSVQEKRELSKLISEEFNRIIQNLQQEIKFTEGEILEEARNKFGVKIIDQEIDNLRDKIQLLEEKKKELGFENGHNSNGFVSTWDHKTNNYAVDPRTQAGRFYYLRLAHCADIQTLQKQRDDRLKKLWLDSERVSITQLINAPIDIKFIELNKKEEQKKLTDSRK